MKPYKVLCQAGSEHWKRLRHARVTATEVYSLLNEERPAGKKWPKTRGELAAAKAQVEPGDFPDTRRMWWGRHSEDANRQAFSAITGIRSRACHAFMESTRVPGLSCTLDALIIAPEREVPEATALPTARPWPAKLRDEVRMRGGIGVLEMKQTDDFFGKEWKTGIPAHYKAQVMAQLVVTGLDYAVIACKIGAANMEAHIVDHPGEIFEKTLREELESFWKEVGNAR